jgi:hypothetical protein
MVRSSCGRCHSWTEAIARENGLSGSQLTGKFAQANACQDAENSQMEDAIGFSNKDHDLVAVFLRTPRALQRAVPSPANRAMEREEVAAPSKSPETGKLVGAAGCPADGARGLAGKRAGWSTSEATLACQRR